MGVSYTTPTTRASAYVVTAADWNLVQNNLLYLATDAPKCRVVRSATQSIPNSALTAVQWNSETYDNDTMHDNVTNNTRITLTHTGIYTFDFYGEFAASTATLVGAVYINGVPFRYFANTGIAAEPGPVPLTYTGHFAAADYVELFVQQNSGGALNITTNSYAACTLIGQYL